MMNPGHNRYSLILPPLAIAFAALIAGAAPAAELVDVSGLVEGLERGCRLPEPLRVFRSELNARYTFEAGTNRLQHKVLVPASYVGAIGRAHAFDHGEYTEVVVPLIGVYRGLKTRSFTFNIGHSNGINVVMLAFNTTRSEVEMIIGGDVAEA